MIYGKKLRLELKMFDTLIIMYYRCIIILLVLRVRIGSFSIQI